MVGGAWPAGALVGARDVKEILPGTMGDGGEGIWSGEELVAAVLADGERQVFTMEMEYGSAAQVMWSILEGRGKGVLVGATMGAGEAPAGRMALEIAAVRMNADVAWGSRPARGVGWGGASARPLRALVAEAIGEPWQQPGAPAGEGTARHGDGGKTGAGAEEQSYQAGWGAAAEARPLPMRHPLLAEVC